MTKWARDARIYFIRDLVSAGGGHDASKWKADNKSDPRLVSWFPLTGARDLTAEDIQYIGNLARTTASGEVGSPEQR